MGVKRFWIAYKIKTCILFSAGFFIPKSGNVAIFFFLLFIFANPLLCFSQQNSLSEIRILFNEAVKNEGKVDELVTLIDNEKIDSPTLLAYKGSTKALVAKSCFNPISKLRHINSSVDMLNEAVSLSPQDIEIRFLRFSIQYYIPKWLGYSRNLEEDKTIIISNIHNYKNFGIDNGVLDWIEEFMINSGYCNNEEIEIIRLAKK